MGKYYGDAGGNCLNPIFSAGKSNQPHGVGNPVLEALCPIPMLLDPRQPASGLLLVLGLEGQAIPREAGPWANTSSPGREPSVGTQPPGSRNACAGAVGCGWAGKGAYVYSLPGPETNFCFELLSLSLPSQVAEFEAKTQSYFPVVPSLFLPRWHGTVTAAGGDYGCAGWEQPRFCLPLVLHPGVPSPGTPSRVGTASGIWHQELELSSFAIRGIGKKPQILEWFEQEAWFGAKHLRRSTQTPSSLQPCLVAVPTSPCPLS